jgi:hypothetical protein
MLYVTRSPKLYLISLAVSIGIFLVIYLTVIKPDQNAANKAFQQGQAQIQQGERQLQNATNQAAKSGGIPAGVTTLTNCIAAAGTNTAQLQACAAHFKK